jgi:hypothetical protein
VKRPRVPDITIRHILLSFYLTATTILAILLAILWYMSPFALGFREWPTDPAARDSLALVYSLSFYLGIPLVVIAQGAAILLHRRIRDRAAFVTATAPIVGFVAFIIYILAQLG